MRSILSRHWHYLITGFVLAALLIVFWYFNQSYLSPQKATVVSVLENPFITFGLIIFGAYVSAYLFGEFSVKVPLTFEPLVYAFLGGITMGVGAAVASMSFHSTVLVNLAGVFTLPAFMLTKGWIYVALMIAGGYLGSKLFVRAIVKTTGVKREIVLPATVTSRKNQRFVFYALAGVFMLTLLLIALLPALDSAMKAGLLVAVLLLVLFGLVTERGTVCMSSMMREWFISHSSHIWRSVLLTVMCLALFYQIGLRLSLYKPIELETYIQSPVLLMTGSFLMGFGFIFADGCFIGSLWKVGQGNLINGVGITGMLTGMAVVETAKSMLGTQPASNSPIINYLGSMISPIVFLAILWVAGVLLLIVFRRSRYRY